MGVQNQKIGRWEENRRVVKELNKYDFNQYIFALICLFSGPIDK